MDKEEENYKNEQIREAILKVLVFFSLFDYPLTSFEIWRYLGIRISLYKMQKVLGKMLNEINSNEFDLKMNNGFYYLSTDNKNIVAIRRRRYNYTNRKIKIALKMAGIFRWVPWVKFIALGNIMGDHNLKNMSDIDFFIITKTGRIWISRFFCAGIIKLLGKRPRVNNTKDKICLSFYISEDHVNLSSLRLEDDYYFDYWLANLLSLYDQNNYHKELLANNKNIIPVFPNWQYYKFLPEMQKKSIKNMLYKDTVELFLGGLEKNLKHYQLKIMPPELKAAMNQDTRVRVSDRVLKLHVKDRREYYRQEYKKKLNKIKTIYGKI